MERGVVRPVATSAAWYPEAIDGLIEFVGVKFSEQLDDDWADVGAMMAPESTRAADNKSGEGEAGFML